MGSEVALKILRTEGIVTPVQIAEAHEQLDRDGHVLSKLVELGADPRSMAEALSRKLSIPLVELVEPSQEGRTRVRSHFGTESILWDKRVLPLAGGPDDVMLLGMADPTDVELVQDLRFALGIAVEPRVISIRDVESILAPPSGASGFFNTFDPQRAKLEEMADYALVHAMKTGQPTSIVAGIEHPDDHAPPFDMTRLQNPTIRGIIRRLRHIADSNDDVASVSAELESGRTANFRIEFRRGDQCATIFFEGFE